jgi:hypothetical protein
VPAGEERTRSRIARRLRAEAVTAYHWLLKAWRAIGNLAFRFSRQLRPVATFSATAFAVGTVAHAAEIPNAHLWARGKPLPWLLVGTGLVTAGRQTIVSVDRRRRKRVAALDDACRRIAAHVHKRCPSIPLTDLGVHVWTIKGPWFARRVERSATFLLRDRRRSAVAWTEGKGVFGLCWERKVPVIVDLDATLYAKAPNEAAFRALPAEERLGLEWHELERTRQYKTIYAAPLFDRSPTKPAIRGIVAVDILASAHYDELVAATEGDNEFNSILGICEGALIG